MMRNKEQQLLFSVILVSMLALVGTGEGEVMRAHNMRILVALVVSVIGIYALGNRLTGLFEPGKGVDLLWLAVAAMMILFAQMGRVQDTWPRRREAQHQQAQPLTREVEAKAPGAHSEEKAR